MNKTDTSNTGAPAFGAPADWPAPASVRSLITTRRSGASSAPYAGFNLATHVGDEPAAVAANRALLALLLPSEPKWLQQVHGTAVADADTCAVETLADAAVARQAGSVCVIMTADCLPVLFCDRAGSVVAAAHAGWRGLAAGVLEATLAAMRVPPDQLMAWLGPAIGPQHFEVGAEVRAAFVDPMPAAATAFAAAAAPGKYLADLYALARLRLAAAGLSAVYGGGACTYADVPHYYSYRRDGRTGRMASLIWLDPA
ncbi:MAG: peptidoglycan editing factor PgeF [Rhodocyclaceae bacterium]|nr:peptidoglycan editing factor PgeF [Rhodocyclaceae bacterium]MBX3666888.1 peptidoglycan editing factor PgeF [Rhodocyclaceae bacterium]